eukprot:1160900-Pelagomonas_calceolata.AAC.1
MPDIQFEIKKVQRSIKECAKSGNIGAAKIARLVFPTPCLMPMPTSAAVQEREIPLEAHFALATCPSAARAVGRGGWVDVKGEMICFAQENAAE